MAVASAAAGPVLSGGCSPEASRLVSSEIASEGLKLRRTFSGFLCRDFIINTGREASCSPRWLRPEWRSSCRSQPVPVEEVVGPADRVAAGAGPVPPCQRLRGVGELCRAGVLDRFRAEEHQSARQLGEQVVLRTVHHELTL